MRIARRLIGYLFALALLVLPLVVWWKYQAILDWWKLRNYNPPASITALADASTMTSSAKHIFYVNHPELESNREEFRKECPLSEQTIVLGCYHSRQMGIAIYDVQDPRLGGVEEVTAAHEMLHAAYDRLSDDERTKIDELLTNYYQTQLNDKRILDTIESYKKTEPNDLVNEMHSIFGTEIAALPVELENYYAKYFSKRTAVVEYAQRYAGEFDNRLKQIEKYDQQLESLRTQINAAEQSLENQLREIEADRDRLDTLKDSGQIAEYNAAVLSFNAKVNAYNQQIARLKRDIATYNDLVVERNAVANELRSLDNALDTRLAPQAAQ